MPRKSQTSNGARRAAPRGSRARKQPAPVTAQPAEAPVVAGGAPETQPVIPHEEIQRLAYFYWLERGGQGGSPEDDWFRAEAELRRRLGRSSENT